MKYLFASLLICLSVSVHAQQNHFIYIQADNRQPFYVKLDSKVLSSSASGYLIIPKLKDSSYDLSIGFPKNEWPEQKVTCNIDRKDVGYLLKNFGEKGWGLFNFQTMDLLMAEVKTEDSTKTVATTNDPFSNALANVVNDPAIKTVEEVKEDTVAVTAPVKKTPVKKEIKTPAKSKAKSPVVYKPKDRILKLLSRRNTDSLRMVYADRVNGSTDTVNVVIPFEKPVAKVIPPRKVAPLKRDTVAKLIVSNKKPAKKPKVDLAKANKKINDKKKDSMAIASAEVKAEEAKTDIVLDTKNQSISPDTAVVTEPAKKLVDILGEMAKIDKKVNEEAISAAEKKRSEDEAAIKKANEEAALAAEKKKAEDEAALAAEKKKAEEEAAVAEEKKKAEEAALAAEKKKAEEEAAVAEEKKKAEEAALAAEKKKADDEAALAEATKKANEEAVLAAEKKKAKEYADSVAQKTLVQEKPKEDIIPKTNSAPAVPTYACKYVADGDEFMSLRKKMLKGKSDNEMLFIAHQLFLKRCVTTKQVERLSVLFTNDLAKYNLFDDAYHFIADADIFPTLQSQLTDEYYIKRFKAMLRQ